MNIYHDHLWFIQTLLSLSKPNKYTKWYISIIHTSIHRFTINPNVKPTQNKRQAKKQLGYCEGHHIIPKSICPEFEFENYNIAYLLPKEHFIVHLLLTKIFESEKNIIKMIFAFRRMLNHNSGKRYTGRLYTLSKISIPGANQGKISITNGINTIHHDKNLPLPTGWYKGCGSIYKNNRQTINNQIHLKSFEITNIYTQDSIIVNDISKWSNDNNIPYSTAISAARLRSVLRNQYMISKIS